MRYNRFAVAMMKVVPRQFRGRLIYICARITRGMTVGVRGIVRDESGRILLLRHSYMSGWHLPGGGVERGEVAEDAMARELAEETGLVLKDRPQLVSIHANGSNHIVLFEIFHWDGDLAPRSAEVSDLKWIHYEDLPFDAEHPVQQRIDEQLGRRPVNPRWSN
jgi:ADP-ribose pyrophosphatase YjhB (NUDIX family)